MKAKEPKKIEEHEEELEEEKLEIRGEESEEEVVKVEKGEEVEKVELTKAEINREAWKPKTKLGAMVKKGEIKEIDEILDRGLNILESEIVDVLLPDAETTLLLIGQAKGKFGGGQRRIFKQTQKKTREGNKPHFATIAVVGDRKGHVGVGYGKSKETVPAREKAIRNAKLNIIKIKCGCGSWSCGCGTQHTIPFKVSGKCGSVDITLMPAPKGKGLVIESECAKIIDLAGIKDILSKTRGSTKTKLNLIYACMDALKKLEETKVRDEDLKKLGLVSKLTKEKTEEES